MTNRFIKDQAVTELAVFGAILIFVVGSILRNAADAGMSQNQSLKAMRYAMLQSLTGIRNGVKARDSARVTFVEDRLAPEGGKFGAMERTPILQVAAATFSNTLFMPLDWLEYHNIPIVDLFVNGIHFPMTTARFVVYDLRIDPGNANQVRIWNLTTNVIRYVPKSGNWSDTCGGAPGGCPIFYRILPSNSTKFCATTCTDTTITMDQRFDLNRNADFTDDPQGSERLRVVWQWEVILGLKDKLNINAKDGNFPTYDIDSDRKEETMYEANPQSLWERTGPNFNVQLGAEPLVHPSIDLTSFEAASINGNVVQQLYTLDYNEGDVSSSFDDVDILAAGIAPMDRGLQRRTSVYTQTGNGTFLEINEGRAYVPAFVPGQEFVRSTNRKDQVDVISRMFVLDNNTGRFCGTLTGTRWATIGNGVTNQPNPVQYCVNTTLFPAANCFTPATVSSTCYDAGTKILFIRSRVQDAGGRRWVTRTK